VKLGNSFTRYDEEKERKEAKLGDEMKKEERLVSGEK